MATIPATTNDMFQVRIVGSQRAQEVENVLHFIALNPSDDVELRLIAALLQCFVLHILPVVTQEFRYDKAVWKRVSPTLSPEFITPFAAGSVGTGGINDLPTYCAVLASIHTLLGGRSHRGRIYLPAPDEGATLGNLINVNGGPWQHYVDFCTCLVTKFITNDPTGQNQYRIGVYSRKIGGAKFPYALGGFTAASQITPTALLATMRSRKQGHGI